MIPKHYKTRELADLLSCHEETILRLAQRGEIHSVLIGGARRYPETAVQEFLERAKAPVRRQREAAVVELADKRHDRATRSRRTG